LEKEGLEGGGGHSMTLAVAKIKWCQW